MIKPIRYKHLRGRHDQRDHNRWPAGYQAQGYTPTGSGKRGSVMASRATGGLTSVTQSSILASNAKWKESVPSNAFARFVKNPKTIVDAIQQAKTLKDGRRFNPAWNIRSFRKVPKSRTGKKGVVKVEVNPDIPGALNLPKRNYLWNRRSKTNNGFGNDNAWIAHDSYVMPLVADALTTAMGMYDSSAASYIPGNTIVNSDISGFPFDLSNPQIVEDVKNGKINIEDQALVDLILGRSETNPTDYVITMTPDGYALRSTNFNDTGVPATESKTLRAENDNRKTGVLVQEQPKSLLIQLMLQNKQNGSNQDRKKVDESESVISYNEDIEIRFSAETLHKLASAQYAMQQDPRIPDSVRMQIAQRIQYVLGKAFHMNQGVSPREMDAMSMDMKNYPVGFSENEMKAMESDYGSAGKSASESVATQSELASQPYRYSYSDSFPLAIGVFQDLARRMAPVVDAIQFNYRELMQMSSQQRSEPLTPYDKKMIEKYFDDINDSSSPISSVNYLYQSVLNSGKAFLQLNEIERRFAKIKQPDINSSKFADYKELKDALLEVRTTVPNLYNTINSYLQNPDSALVGGLTLMNLRELSRKAIMFSADIDNIQKFMDKMFSNNK
jgi:hypothetical protein